MNVSCINPITPGCEKQFVYRWVYGAREVPGGFMVEGEDRKEYMFYEKKSPRFSDHFMIQNRPTL